MFTETPLKIYALTHKNSNDLINLIGCPFKENIRQLCVQELDWEKGDFTFTSNLLTI